MVRTTRSSSKDGSTELPVKSETNGSAAKTPRRTSRRKAKEAPNTAPIRRKVVKASSGKKSKSAKKSKEPIKKQSTADGSEAKNKKSKQPVKAGTDITPKSKKKVNSKTASTPKSAKKNAVKETPVKSAKTRASQRKRKLGTDGKNTESAKIPEIPKTNSPTKSSSVNGKEMKRKTEKNGSLKSNGKHSKQKKRRRQEPKRYSIKLGSFKAGLKKARSEPPLSKNQDHEMLEESASDDEDKEIKMALAADEEVAGGESEIEEELGKRVKVHRCRFVDWKPDAVHVIASAGGSGDSVAVAREGGDIEIWNLKEGFHQEFVVPGRRGKSSSPVSDSRIRSLVWCKAKASGKRRLFGAGLDGCVFEVDIARIGYSEVVDAYGGAIWAMDINSSHDTLATGCEDGHIRLFDVSSETGIEYMRPLRTTHEGRVLSLKWHPTEEDTLFSAGIDGIIRKWNVDTGRVVSTLELETFGRQTPPFVWSMLVLRDSTVIVGDSYGQVQFWDGREDSGFLLKSFREHKADVLALTCSADETKVFASGIDSRVSMFACNPEDKGASRWVYSYSHRPHTHDVLALASVVYKGQHTLLSGGVDTQLCYYPIPTFKRTRPKKVGPFKHSEIVHVTEKLTAIGNSFLFMMVQQPRQVQIYKMELNQSLTERGAQIIGSKTSGMLIKRHNDLNPPNLIAEISFQQKNSIRSSSISKDGKYIAVSDDAGLHIFSLKVSTKSGDETHELERVKHSVLSHKKSDGVPICLAFSGREQDQNLNLVCAMQSGVVHIISGLDSTLIVSKSLNDNDGADNGVTFLQASSDSNWMSCIRKKGDVLILNLKTFDIHAEIPKALFDNSKPRICKFHSSDSSCMLVVCSNNAFFSYSVQERKLSKWSENQSDKIPPAILNHQSRFRGVCSDSSQPQKFCLWGASLMLFVDTTKRLSLETGKQTKRELYRPSMKSSDFGLKLRDFYQPLVFADYVGENELVVVESPWIKVMQHFPDVLNRKKYGGNN